MEYLNLHVAVLDSEQFIGSEPVDQATWLKLQRYCIGQENGGRIEDCREWKDRKCQQLLRITRVEMLRECDLWEWDGDALVLFGYPLEQEAVVRAKREAGRSGGRARTQAKAEAARANGRRGGQAESQAKGQAEPKQNPSEDPTERKGKEGKGKESTTTTACGREELPEHERLINAYARPSFDRGALEAAQECMRRHRGVFGFDRILEAVQRVTALVALWSEDERTVYLPTAANFFRDDGWRKHPDEWASRRDAKKRSNGARPGLSEEERAARLGGRA